MYIGITQRVATFIILVIVSTYVESRTVSVDIITKVDLSLSFSPTYLDEGRHALWPADLPTPPQTIPQLRSELIFVPRVVLSGLLQVCNVLITVFALHFSSSAIHGLKGLSKVGMVEITARKAGNEIVHGRPQSS